MALNKYEQEQVKAIKAWEREEPGVVSKTFGVVTAPVAWLVQLIIPQAAFKGVIDGANAAAEWFADQNDIIKSADISAISDLQNRYLSLSDRLANEIHNWAIGIATAEGAATGATGIVGLTVDIPAIVTLALRTVHKIGLCYGYECVSEIDKQFVLGILAASGANTVSEKVAALTTLRSIEVAIAKQTWKAMAEKAAQQQLSKEGAIISVKNLAKELGVNLTKRKALQAIPAIGAIVGGSVNGWYVKDVGWAARRAFQGRWLIGNHKMSSKTA